VEDYDIDPHVDIAYDSYGNLGFEDGIIHWNGHANTYSTISIELDPFEGLNSLKLSISVDTSSFEGSSESVLAEISKSLDVVQGDTVSLSFQLRSSFDDSVEGISLFNTRSFHDLNGQEIEEEQDTINQISTQWQMVNVKYPVPQDAVSLVFGVRIAGAHEAVHAHVDDFSITIDPLSNQVPSEFSLLSPADGSTLPADEQIELSWGLANDLDGDPVTYDMQIWTDAVVENYLANSSFDEVVTHWLGDEIPADWDYWPYYYHNVFSYPQLGDSTYNQDYVYSGDHSMWITGDFTGQSNKTILYQAFSADYIPPGTRVTFSGYMLNPSTDPIKNNNQGYISIDQFASGGSSFNNSTLILNHTAESITSGHSLDDWHYFEVSSTTEENTNYLQIRINYEQFNDDSGTVFIDDLTINTNNTRLILHESKDIDTTSISVDRTVFTDPYDFNSRESLIYYWDILAKDNFSSTPSKNGPFRLNLNQ
jgi:hypothetical protein